MIKAVLFDLDDTLFPEKEFVLSGFRCCSAALLRLGFPLTECQIYKKLLALFAEDSKQVFNRLFDAFQMPYTPDDIAFLVSLFRDHLPVPGALKLYDDVPPLLKQLKANQFSCGIITDGFALSQRHKLKALDLETKMDQIIVSAEQGPAFVKPNEASFLLMSQALKLDCEEMVYIGDNPQKDFFISSLLPIKCIRILRPNSIYAQAEYRGDVKECLRIDTLEGLLPKLGALA